LPLRGKFYTSLRYACVTSTGHSQLTHIFFLASCLSEQPRTNDMEKANASRFTSIWKPQPCYATGTDGTNPTVVFTSEAKNMIQDQRDFETNTTLNKDFPFSFQFLTNHKEMTPDSGFVKNIKRTVNFTADEESMLSAVASLKFQLLPRVLLGNCCSNFHVLLNDFLVEGLGAASENTFKCLQEFEDPRVKICCGWHRECKRARAEALAVLGNKTAAASAI
jgi:hypothetical protein